MQRVHNEQWEIVRAQTSIVWDHDGPGSAELCSAVEAFDAAV